MMKNILCKYISRIHILGVIKIRAICAILPFCSITLRHFYLTMPCSDALKNMVADRTK